MRNKLAICQWVDFCKERYRDWCSHAKVHTKWSGCDYTYCTYFAVEVDNIGSESRCIVIDDQIEGKKKWMKN